MGILAISAIMVAGAGFYLFSQSFPNFKPGEKKIQADLKTIRQEVLKSTPDLTPMRTEDLESLSSKEMDKSIKKRATTDQRGVFVTIFEEPAAAYYHRKYLSNKRDALIFAKTYHHEYTYWIKGDEVNLVIDQQPLGVYNEKTGELIGARSQKMIAKLDKSKPAKMEMTIQGRAVGNIVAPRPGGKDTLSQRCFDFVRNDLSKEEEAILLAIAIFEMVERKV
ncbi:hypothetical protein [Haliscomenobacter sp.]|uniref:hypothetical protein n=1 Tax=Haliscomenobacter sp. TaxID=2717303 RepID=UPI003593AF6F